MIYGQPAIQVSTSLDMFFERLLPRTVLTLAERDWRAKKLIEFIDQHQGNVRWSLGEVCKQLGFPVSDRQARRLFKVSMGLGIKKYSMNKRLACAAEKLRTTSIPVKVVAADAGYQSTRNFARRFKELFHLRPMEFRRVWRQRDIAA